VLASGAGGCIGVDLDTGAFTFPHWLDHRPAMLAPFDVAVAEVAPDKDVLDPARPEGVAVLHPPRAVGRMRGRVAERYVRPLLLPAGQHLLGIPGPTVPYWTLSGNERSLCLVAPTGTPVVVRRAEGVRCRFVWRGVAHELPMSDTSLAGGLGRAAHGRLGGTALAEVLGFLPQRLLVALTPPRDGHCYKVVAGLLPRR
jgi:hypothetical protein